MDIQVSQPPMVQRAAPLISHRTRTPDVQIHLRTLKDVTPVFLQAWHDLEQNALSGHPFLSADFVLPAARSLPQLCPPVILTAERRGELLALGVFENITRSLQLPVRHLRSWQTLHTYHDGLLLRNGESRPALEAFWRFLARGQHDWHGVQFPRMPMQEELTRLLTTSSLDVDACLLQGTRWERACLHIDEQLPQTLQTAVSPRRAKSLRRGWRELEKSGSVDFRFECDPQAMPGCAEELLQLEHAGWKCDEGSSLASDPAQSTFFRNMVALMAQRQAVYFSKISIDGQAIASVVNLRAGNTAYAFKLGWNPDFERGCPGFHLKMQTASRIAAELPGIRCLDSCSQPGSFIEHVWPHRRQFSSYTFATSPVGQIAATMAEGLRWMKRSAAAMSRNLFHSDSNRTDE
jgi:CelD/BcsL family acetyltransferase involved in cellulose biosynthesis